MTTIYLIGSLRNEKVPDLANKLRRDGFEVFDDWFAAGPEADDHWQAYETQRGRSYSEALKGHAAGNVFAFDRRHIERADVGVLLLPAGKSGHLELGFMIGRGKPGFILYDKTPERYDVMYQFASGVFVNYDDLVMALRAGAAP